MNKKKKKKNISGLHSSLDVEYCLQNGAPFCDHSNLGFLEVTWWCGHRRTTPEMLCGVLLQCWDHVDRAWHTPLRLQARCWPSFLCRVILLSTMNITDDHCWMARPTCHLGHCRCARQCLAFIGCNTTVIWISSHSGEAWSGWSDQTHWFQWRPSNVPVVVLQWHPDGVRRGSSDTGADDTALSVTREAPLRPFVHWTSVPMSRSQSACHTQSSWTKSVCMPSVWIQALLLSQLTSVNHDYFKWPQWTLIIHCLL